MEQLRFVSEETEAEALIAEALRARPEVLARSAAIGEAQTRVKQEHMRPWLPTVSAGYSYGGMAGGSNLVADDFSNLKGCSNFDVLAVWSARNLWIGNRAQVRQADAWVGAAVAEFDLTVNRIRREVVEALADARTAATQINTSEKALAAAEEGFRLEMVRIKQGVWRPIEVLDSFRQLLESRQELLRAMIAYDIAQFRLHVATGQTPEPGR